MGFFEKKSVLHKKTYSYLIPAAFEKKSLDEVHKPKLLKMKLPQ